MKIRTKYYCEYCSKEGVNFNRPQENNNVIKHHILINPNKENMQLTLDEFCDTIKWQPINYDKLMERKDKI